MGQLRVLVEAVNKPDDLSGSSSPNKQEYYVKVSHAEEKWHVLHTYSEFRTLRESMLKELKNLPDEASLKFHAKLSELNFPGKRIFGSQNIRVATERASELTTFMRSLVLLTYNYRKIAKKSKFEKQKSASKLLGSWLKIFLRNSFKEVAGVSQIDNKGQVVSPDSDVQPIKIETVVSPEMKQVKRKTPRKNVVTKNNSNKILFDNAMDDESESVSHNQRTNDANKARANPILSGDPQISLNSDRMNNGHFSDKDTEPQGNVKEKSEDKQLRIPGIKNSPIGETKKMKSKKKKHRRRSNSESRARGTSEAASGSLLSLSQRNAENELSDKLSKDSILLILRFLNRLINKALMKAPGCYSIAPDNTLHIQVDRFCEELEIQYQNLHNDISDVFIDEDGRYRIPPQTLVYINEKWRQMAKNKDGDSDNEEDIYVSVRSNKRRDKNLIDDFSADQIDELEQMMDNGIAGRDQYLRLRKQLLAGKCNSRSNRNFRKIYDSGSASGSESESESEEDDDDEVYNEMAAMISSFKSQPRNEPENEKDITRRKNVLNA